MDLWKGRDVEVKMHGRWYRTTVRAEPEYGFVLLSGVAGQQGPFSARVTSVRECAADDRPEGL